MQRGAATRAPPPGGPPRPSRPEPVAAGRSDSSAAERARHQQERAMRQVQLEIDQYAQQVLERDAWRYDIGSYLPKATH